MGCEKSERGDGDSDKQVSQVTSRIRLAAALSSALAEAPAPDPAAPRVPRLRAPVRGTFAEARTPRSSRFGGQPAVASRAARVNRLPRPRRSPFGLPLRFRAPVRASRAVKPRSPAPFALQRTNPPGVAAPAPPASTAATRSAAVRVSPPLFARRSSRLRRSSGAPPGDVAGIRVAASQAACSEPLATRSAEPSNSTTWDNLNTIPKSERCQAFFQANFSNLEN